MTNIERHKELCDLLNDTYIKKNLAYGDSFGKTFRELGVISAVTRMSDKWNRILALVVHNVDNKVADEKLTDTLLDLSNYCLMTMIELEKREES